MKKITPNLKQRYPWLFHSYNTDCEDIEYGCNKTNYQKTKKWIIGISIAVYIILIIELFILQIEPIILSFIIFATFIFGYGVIDLILSKYRNYLDYKDAMLQFRIFQIQKYINNCNDCTFKFIDAKTYEFQHSNDPVLIKCVKFVDLCNCINNNFVIDISNVQFNNENGNNCSLWQLMTNIKEKINNQEWIFNNRETFIKMLQSNENKLKSLLLNEQTRISMYKLYNLSQGPFSNSIENNNLQIEYKKFTKELLVISEKRESCEIICNQVNNILTQYGENAYQFSKNYLTDIYKNKNSYQFILSLAAGGFFGVLFSFVYEIFDAIGIFGAAIFFVGLTVYNLYDYKYTNKRILNFNKIQNDTLVLTILQDFCNKHEKNILNIQSF